MACRILALLILSAAPTAESALVKSSAFLATEDGDRMRPDVVAKTLAAVETEWKDQAAVFTECNASEAGSNCMDAHKSFDKSCATVVSAIVQGSSGDRQKATEYMADVCGQNMLAAWQKLRCSDLASAVVDHAMSADNYANRNTLNPSRVCTGFWSKFVDAERKREAVEAKERAEKEAQEAKERVEREAREAKEAAEAKKKAEEEAKAEAVRRAAEEVKKAQEEKEEKSRREAAEARDRADEAAKRLAEKKAEAEKMQLEAQLKAEEAKEAEKEHEARQAEHVQAQEALHATVKNTDEKEVVAEKKEVVAEKKEVVAEKKEVAAEKKDVVKVAVKTEAVAPKPAAVAPKDAAPKEAVQKVATKAEAVPKKADAKATQKTK